MSRAVVADVRRAGRRLPPLTEAETFGVRLRRMRMRRGLTQAELAFRAGTTAPYVSQLESGVREEPGGRVLLGFADALKVSVDWLLGRPA